MKNEIPTDIKICAMITAFCLLGMVIVLPIAIYQKITAPEPKDWRDGYSEWKQTMERLNG